MICGCVMHSCVKWVRSTRVGRGLQTYLGYSVVLKLLLMLLPRLAASVVHLILQQ